MPSEEEIAKIIELHNNNYSQGQIAKELGKGKTTINRVLQGLGLTNGTDQERSGTKKATDAKRTYDRQRRLELNDKIFEKLEAWLDAHPTIEKPHELRDIIWSYGVVSDKRAALEPESGNDESELLKKFTDALDAHALSAQTSGCVPGLPQDQADPDVRVGEERQD